MQGFTFPSTKEKLPLVGLGTHQIKQDYYYIRKAISLGYTLIDTAENYQEGKAEEAVGKAIKSFDRTKLFIISKVSPNHLKYGDLIKSAISSVQRLDTFIDLYLIHMPNKSVPLEESFSAMKKLQERHIIRFYGVSNFELEDFKKTIKFGIKANQHEFSLIYRYYEDELNLCLNKNILFLAYRPLSHGELLGVRYDEIFKPFVAKYKKSKSQIALRWIIEKRALPIVGSNNIEHLKENLDVNWEIEKEDIIKLDKIFKKLI